MYVQHDPEYHYFNFNQIDRQRLRPVVLFDYLVNNADRKGSHVLVDNEDHMWLIDHGICFHVDDKLRTVIWDFAGEKIPKRYSADLIKFRQALTDTGSWVVGELGKYIDTDEITAIITRTSRVLARGHFLNPPPNRRAYPWPPV